METWRYKSAKQVVKIGPYSCQKGKIFAGFQGIFCKNTGYLLCAFQLLVIQVFTEIIVNETESGIDGMFSEQIEIAG